MENPAPKDAILKGKWQVSKVPPGSTKTVACVKRSVKMDRFYKFGTLNSGDPECVYLRRSEDRQGPIAINPRKTRFGHPGSQTRP